MSSTTLNFASDLHGTDIPNEADYFLGDAVQMEEHTPEKLDELLEDFEGGFIPGNHDFTGEHGNFDVSYNDITDQIDEEQSVYTELTGNEGEDLEDAESIFDTIIHNHEDVDDLRDTFIENDNHVVYFGDSHQDPEIPDPESRDGGFGYDFEDIAEQLESGGSDQSHFGGFLSYLNPFNYINAAKDKLGGDSDNNKIDPEEFTYEDVPEELRTEAHSDYIAKREELEDKLTGYDKPVIVADHAIARDEEWKHGSDVLRDLAEEGTVDLIVGGHDHNPGVKEIGDAAIVNTAGGLTEIELEDGEYVDSEYTQLVEDKVDDEEDYSVEEVEKAANAYEMDLASDEYDSFDELWNDHYREDIENRIRDTLDDDYDEDRVEEMIDMRRQDYHSAWENRDDIKYEEILEEEGLYEEVENIYSERTDSGIMDDQEDSGPQGAPA